MTEPDPIELEQIRQMVELGELPGKAEDDRSLARMLGIAAVLGLLIWAAIIYGLLSLL